MKLLIHYLKILGRIISSSYDYNRTKLIWCYTKLTFRSVLHHKLKSPKAKKKNELYEESIMGFKVGFFDYIQIITLFEEIFIYQCYKFKCDNDPPFIIDCGSNIGLSVLYFKSIYPKATVTCFEPDTQSFNLMVTNVGRNHLENVTCYNLALTGHSGRVTLFKTSDAGSLGMSLISIPNSYSEEVQGESLSDYIHQGVDLLKLDVEGSEIQILNNLFETEKLDNIKQMVIEFHPSRTKSDLNTDIKKLVEQGFDFTERDVGHRGTDKIIFLKNRKFY